MNAIFRIQFIYLILFLGIFQFLNWIVIQSILYYINLSIHSHCWRRRRNNCRFFTIAPTWHMHASSSLFSNTLFFDFFDKLCNCSTRFVGLALILKRYSISLQLVSSFKIANWNGSFYHFAPLFEFFMPIINGVMTNTRQLQQKTVTITIYISITQCIIFTWRYAIYYGLQMPNTKKEEKKTDLQQCSDKTNMKTEFTCKYTFCTYV